MSWHVTLPVFEPEIFDNSMLETHQRCPRLGLYRYGLRRAPKGKNYPIGFGIAYHKYRETVEEIMRDHDLTINPDVHADGVMAALSDWEDPPLEDRKSYLNRSRLEASLDLARRRIEYEQREGKIKVVRTEDAFDLALPDSDERYGGRMDQIVDWNGKLWIRDFKTTSRMGRTYPQQFDPNNQMTGYVWGGQQLSGREVQGVIIETVYNTKTKGPEIKQFLSTRSPGQIEQWLATTYVDISSVRSYYERLPHEGYLAFPQRTSACDMYGGCYFRNACSKDNGPAIERWLEQNTQYSEWDFMDPEKEEQSED